MTWSDNVQQMHALAGPILDGMLGRLDRLLVHHGDRAWLPYGRLPAVDRLKPWPNETPSSRLTSDLAMGYLAAARLGGDERYFDTACRLLRHTFDRQGPSGEFVFNYGQYEVDQVDLGTVLDTYHYFWRYRDDLPADVREGVVETTRRAIAYLKGMHQPDYPGIIRKRAADPAHPEARRSAGYCIIDVLNGNALAMTAYCRGAEILEDPSLIDRAAMFEANLIERFGAHVEGWWVYVEKLGSREMLTAETILYQAMTALYIEPLLRARPSEAMTAVTAESLRTLAAVTDADGRLDWSHEARQDFVRTHLLMLPSAAAALADVCDITDAGLRRMRYIADTLVDGETGLLLDEPDDEGRQAIADELRQLWGVSDLALILFFAERARHAASTS